MPIMLWQVEDENWINVPANITGWGKRSSSELLYLCIFTYMV